jgi:hypothetical protein
MAGTLAKIAISSLWVHLEHARGFLCQVYPNGMYDCSTAVRHAKNPTGRTTSLKVGCRWVENHGSLPGFWKAERLHLLEVVSGNIFGGRSTSGATASGDLRIVIKSCQSPSRRVAFNKFRQDGLLLLFGFPRYSGGWLQ